MTIEKQGAEFDLGDLCRAIEQNGGLYADTAKEVFQSFAAILPDILQQHGRIELHGMGVLEMEDRKGKIVPDIHGGPGKQMDDYKKIVFRASEPVCKAIEAVIGINVV